jgi:SRSO17 transposase
VNARALAKLDERLEDFVGAVTPAMGRSERRHWAQLYLRGLLLDGERKSIEPMARRLGGGDEQAMQQFIGQSPWAADAVHESLNAYLLGKLAAPTYWVIDETSFPKQGEHSVGVARQYCGAAGKIANCQVAVSLHYCDLQSSWPVGWKLYLPQSWVEDESRRRKAAVPKEIIYRSKPQLALELIDQAQQWRLRGAVVLADCLYGNGLAWRGALRQRQLEYCVAVEASTGVWAQPALSQPPRYSGKGRPAKRPPRKSIESLKQLAFRLPRRCWQKVSWRQGTRGPMRSRFAWLELCAATRTAANAQLDRWTEWALIEWPEGAPEPLKYWLSWWRGRAPETRELVQTAKARWRIEQDYRELKEELGLDHFEGRGWIGWHHHVTMVSLAFAFLRLEQARSKKNDSFQLYP